jgi:DUF4097 and DUF4098 domain-containing protein YvlB
MMIRKILTLAVVLFLAAPLASAERVEKKFSVGRGGTLDVDIETGGDVIVTGSGGSQVSVFADLKEYYADEVDLVIESSGNTVQISTTDKRHRRRSSTSFIFEVSVPSEFNVTINSSGGDVRIESVEGEFRGETMGGDLVLRGIRGEVNLRTMGGDVDLRDAIVDGSLSTMGGDLTLELVEGDLKTSTMGGDVTLSDVSGDVDAETMGGDVSSRHAGNRARGSADGAVRLKTMGGEVSVDEAPEGADVETMGGDITVRSAGEFVKAHTMGGDIELLEVDGWVKATTMGGDVSVRIVDRGSAESRDVEIKSHGGDIDLIVPDGFSMDVDIEITWTREYREQPRIDSDFSLNVTESPSFEYDDDHDRRGGRRKIIRGEGSIRGGQNRVKIRTVNGDVRLKRS